MNQSKTLKVFVQEDDLLQREKIADELRDNNYEIYFFPKEESIFDLFSFNPDIIIQDYFTKKIINLYEWTLPI